MKKQLIFLSIVALLILGWYLFSPLFIDTQVNEAFPETVMETQETPSSVSIIPTETHDAGSETVLPQLILSGTFEDVDIVHKGRGIVKIYELSSGTQVLRLEDFEVTNGPSLHVILSAHPRPRSSAEVKDAGYLDLGNLKGSVGNQNYTLPDNTDVSQFKSVVIYCYPFNVVFSTGTLK